jgi:uncharacterized membrane protein
LAIPTTIEEEYAKGEEAATLARGRVADQLSEALRECRRTGSMDLVVKRVKALGTVWKDDDQEARRGAAMELAEAAALLAVSIDLHQPVESSRPRARSGSVSSVTRPRGASE